MASVVIDLTSSDADEGLPRSRKRRLEEEPSTESKHEASRPLPSPLPNAPNQVGALSLPLVADDDEPVILHSTGSVALKDFPHARENCLSAPFVLGDAARAHCPNCYCFVCDLPVAACDEWDEHCQAQHHVHRWQQAREAQKAKARASGSQGQGPSASRPLVLSAEEVRPSPSPFRPPP